MEASPSRSDVSTASPATPTTTTTTPNKNLNNLLELGAPIWVRRKGQPQLEGEVAYLGPVQFAEGNDWVGVRLTGPSSKQGKHAGSVEGVKYFSTSSHHQGLFVRHSAIKPRTTIATIALTPEKTGTGGVGSSPRNQAATTTTTTTSPPSSQTMTRTPVVSDAAATAAATAAAMTQSPASPKTPESAQTDDNNNSKKGDAPPMAQNMFRTPVAAASSSSQNDQEEELDTEALREKYDELEAWRRRTGRPSRTFEEFLEGQQELTKLSTAKKEEADAFMARTNQEGGGRTTDARQFTNLVQAVAQAQASTPLAPSSNPKSPPTTGPKAKPANGQKKSPPKSSAKKVAPTTTNNTAALAMNSRELGLASEEPEPPSPHVRWAEHEGGGDSLPLLLESETTTTSAPPIQQQTQRGLPLPPPMTTTPTTPHDPAGPAVVEEREGIKEAASSWCQLVWCSLLILGSLIPPAALAASLVVPVSSFHIVRDIDPSDFLTRLTAGLILGQVGTGLLLLIPLLMPSLCCCWCGTESSTLSWNCARVAAIMSGWMGLLVLVLTFWLSPENTDHNKIVLMGGSGGTILLAALGLMVSFWPSKGRGPKMFTRHLYPMLNTVSLSGSVNGGEGSNNNNNNNNNNNSLTQPLLAPSDEEAPEAAAAPYDEQHEEEAEVTETGRVRGTRRLLQLASSQVLYLYMGCIVLLIRLPFSLAIPHFVSTTLAALGKGEYHHAREEILYLFILGSIDAALDFWCIFLFGYANQRIVRGVRLDLFHRLLNMEVAFFDRNNTGTLASRLNSDCSEMAGDLTWFFRFSIESVVRIIGITAYMLIRSPRLGACALSIVPVVGVINKLYGDWLRQNAIAVQDALAEANAVAQEALSNVRTVISFAAEHLEESHYRAKIEHQFQLNVQQLFMQGVYYMAISTFLINTFVQAALLYYGAHLIQKDQLTAEVLLAFMLYQGQLQNETLNLFQSYSSLIKSSGAGDKVFALLDRQPPPPASGSDEQRGRAAGESEPEPLSYDLSLQNVSFSYPTRPTQRVLNRMVLDIPQGSTVAIVGPSGSGKSTVVNLLQRFYDPVEGAIMLNGRDLRSYDLQEHRRRIGVVSQDSVLFDGSVIENITYGSHCRGEAVDDSTTLRDVRRAAILAHADDFVSKMPQGYHTVVGEKGVQLSGGQRQRVCIARAIYQRPLLLILDEATSALDQESEKVVQEALDDLLQRQNMRKQQPLMSPAEKGSDASPILQTTTTVVIAHRLHTVENADFIAVLGDGRVAEFGPPENLMRRPNGLYRELVERARETGRIAES